MNVQCFNLFFVQCDFYFRVRPPCDPNEIDSFNRADSKLDLVLDELSQFLKSVIPGNGTVKQFFGSEFIGDIRDDLRGHDSIGKLVLYPGELLSKS